MCSTFFTFRHSHRVYGMRLLLELGQSGRNSERVVRVSDSRVYQSVNAAERNWTTTHLRARHRDSSGDVRWNTTTDNSPTDRRTHSVLSCLRLSGKNYSIEKKKKKKFRSIKTKKRRRAWPARFFTAGFLPYTRVRACVCRSHADDSPSGVFLFSINSDSRTTTTTITKYGKSDPGEFRPSGRE